MKLYTLPFLVLALFGCASAPVATQFNIPEKTIQTQDFRMGADENSKAPFEFHEKNGLSVGYNLRGFDDEFTLRLIFKNKTNSALKFAPRVTIVNAQGFVVNPQDLRNVLQNYSSSASMPVPAVYQANPQSYYNSGVLTDQTSGKTYNYSGTSTPSGGAFAQGFGIGAMIGEALAARSARKYADEVMSFTTRYWLRSEYELPVGASDVGLLYYTVNSISSPMKISVTVNGEVFEFKTL